MIFILQLKLKPFEINGNKKYIELLNEYKIFRNCTIETYNPFACIILTMLTHVFVKEQHVIHNQKKMFFFLSFFSLFPYYLSHFRRISILNDNNAFACNVPSFLFCFPFGLQANQEAKMTTSKLQYFLHLFFFISLQKKRRKNEEEMNTKTRNNCVELTHMWRRNLCLWA